MSPIFTRSTRGAGKRTPMMGALGESGPYDGSPAGKESQNFNIE